MLRVLSGNSTLALRAGFAFTVRGLALSQCHSDLDHYTYAVAGTLVLLLSDLWAWFDHTDTDRTHAIGYGRALQAVNILIDRREDTGRGVDFWPQGWELPDMLGYAERELVLATAYLDALRPGPARVFCERPLANACDAARRLRQDAAQCAAAPRQRAWANPV